MKVENQKLRDYHKYIVVYNFVIEGVLNIRNLGTAVNKHRELAIGIWKQKRSN
jgi:hypothetical protein